MDDCGNARKQGVSRSTTTVLRRHDGSGWLVGRGQSKQRDRHPCLHSSMINLRFSFVMSVRQRQPVAVKNAFRMSDASTNRHRISGEKQDA